MSDDAAGSTGRRFTLLIRDENDGMLWAEVQELPGCFASGTDMNGLMEAAVEAIGMYLSDAGSDAALPSEVSDDDVPGEVLAWPGRTTAGEVHYAVERAQILLEA